VFQFAFKNMMRKLIFIFILVSAVIGAQPMQNFILTESNFIPSGNSFQLFLSYRIPYNRIVFEKRGNEYHAFFRINIEVLDSAGKFLTRSMTEKKLNVASYDESISRNSFTEGLITLNLNQTSVKIIPLFTDLITNTETRAIPIDIRSYEEGSNFLNPIVVKNQSQNCGEIKSSLLANYGGMIPFSKESYNLVFASIDTSINSFNCLIVNNEDTVFNSQLNNGVVNKLTFSECDDKIILSSNTGNNSYKIFTIKNISDKLEEGRVAIILSGNEKFNKKNVFNKEVKWFNKPFSLHDQELAAKTLRIIEDDEIVSEIHSANEDKFMEKLLDVWKKYDPTKETKFNELMEQYYSRVDYSIKNFSTITGKHGWDTDRGTIYIQYGSPDEIKRYSDDHGKIVETWNYIDPAKRFSFVDRTGTGEFVILSQK
jgi:GWxTD domain-containing protein